MSLRALPSVDAVLATDESTSLLERIPRPAVADAIRAVLAESREAIRADPERDAPAAEVVARRAAERIRTALAPELPAVVNATGVVLHTNLGRAPLSAGAIESLVHAARGAVAVELDVSTGRRGQRDAHVADLLAELTGAEAGLVVNNNAAALLLAIDSLARRREVIVSRGELIEIGGAFRLPEVLQRAGAVLREVGTTNRTRLADYEAVLSRRTGVLLRAHPSNYRVEGFTEKPSRPDLAALARRHGVPFVEDLGSGALVDLAEYGLPHEPTPAEAIRDGADLVTFSGDKLLGGPQAGLVVGRAALVRTLQKNPLKRALRVDKLILAALRATLVAYRGAPDVRSHIPTISLLARTEEDLEALASEARDLVAAALPEEFDVAVIPSEAEIGSGAQPTVALPSRALRVRRSGWDAERLASFFRAASPPILGRIHRDELLLDLRAVRHAADLVPHVPEATAS